MDPTLLQLFSLDEILDRLAQKQRSGCLHVFTFKESANIFFRDGVIVAAAKGLVEGEEVIKQVLEWRDPRMMWQADASASGFSFKPLSLQVADLLKKGQPVPAPSGRQEKLGSKSKPTPLKGIVSDRPLVVLGAVKASLTGPVQGQPVAPTPSFNAPIAANTPVEMTATKTISSTSSLRAAQEHALLEKHKLALQSTENPEQRLKITRASTLIGRNPACDITIDHGSISRQHCLLQLTDRGLHAKDLGTTNGTKVNGIDLKEGYISVGNKLTIGHLEFVLEKE